jgi:hypothetical protein
VGKEAITTARGGSRIGVPQYVQNLAARSFVLAGEYDEALDLLEQLHDKMDFTTSGWLRIDPEWAPLHGNPRFEKLIARD